MKLEAGSSEFLPNSFQKDFPDMLLGEDCYGKMTTGRLLQEDCYRRRAAEGLLEQVQIIRCRGIGMIDYKLPAVGARQTSGE